MGCKRHTSISYLRIAVRSSGQVSATLRDGHITAHYIDNSLSGTDITAICYATDNVHIAIGTKCGRIYLCHENRTTILSHKRPVTSLFYSFADKYLFVVSYGQQTLGVKLRIWHINTNHWEKISVGDTTDKHFFSGIMAVSPDHKLMALGSKYYNGRYTSINIYQLEKMCYVTDFDTEHDHNPIKKICFASTDLLITFGGSMYRYIKIWDLRQAPVALYKVFRRDFSLDFCFVPLQNKIYTVETSGHIICIDIDSGLIKRWEYILHVILSN